MLDKLFGKNAEVMASALDGLSMRQKAIAENVANADTPHYKRFEVAFEGALARTVSRPDAFSVPMAATHPGHYRVDGPQSLDDFQATVSRSSEVTMRNDGNNVDIDAEMTRLAQANVTYNAIADLMKRKMTGLHSIIRGN
ncbi:MAG TPA: flagellar basal body rod protein FlgB [Pantanalinema sp.]